MTKDEEILSPVNFVSRWMPPQTLLSVSPQHLAALRVPQAVLAKVELRGATKFLGIRALVPNLHFPLSHFDDSRAAAVPTLAIVVQFLQLLLLKT